jgi:hypothetical protein
MGLSQVQKAWAALPSGDNGELVRGGPQEFAARILADFRAKQTSGSDRWKQAFPCSDSSVRQLVEMAFYASLLKEEGKEVRLRLVLASDNASLLPPTIAVRFTTPVPIGTPTDLAKLSPILSSQNIGLWVTETPKRGGKYGLSCLGLLDLNVNASDSVIGFPKGAVWDGGFGNSVIADTTYFNLRVNGCGHLRAHFAMHYEQELRAGAIAPFCFFAEAPPTATLLMESSNLLSRQLVKAHNPSGLFDTHAMQRAMIGVWAQVLQTLIARRHGGCFVILPEPATTMLEIRSESGYLIRGGYPVDLDIGRELIELFNQSEALVQLRKSVAAAPSANKFKEFTELETSWLRKRRELRFAVATLADLGTVDGCVVLDRQLRCYLAGAKLERQPLPAVASMRELRDWNSGASLEEAIAKLGKRNGSACDFCRDHLRAFAFVVSQDEELRLYYSDEKAVYGFENLSAG